MLTVTGLFVNVSSSIQGLGTLWTSKRGVFFWWAQAA